MFKLKQFLSRAYVRASGIPLSLKLTYLNLRYGRGNIPADKLPKILSDDPEDRKAFFQTLEVCGLLYKILGHYRIEMQDSVVACMVSRYMHMDSESEEERMTVYDLMVRSDRAVALLHLVQKNDVHKNKLRFFGPPPPFDTMEAWVTSLDANRYSIPQS